MAKPASSAAAVSRVLSVRMLSPLRCLRFRVCGMLCNRHQTPGNSSHHKDYESFLQSPHKFGGCCLSILTFLKLARGIALV